MFKPPRIIFTLIYFMLLLGTGLVVASASPLFTSQSSVLAETPQLIATLPLTATQITTDSSPVFMPLLLNQIPPTPTPTSTPEPVYTPVTLLYCNSEGFAIPDENPQGASSRITINEPGVIQDLDIALDASHSWIGDLVFSLEHIESGIKVILIARPGYPAIANGCEQDGINTILDDEISSPVEHKCASSPLGISGIFLPEEPLSAFDNLSATGNWKFKVTDNYRADTGRVNRWCLAVTISNTPYSPTPIPS